MTTPNLENINVSAFDNMRKAAQQANELAQSNIAAATSATVKAAKKATGK